MLRARWFVLSLSLVAAPSIAQETTQQAPASTETPAAPQSQPAAAEPAPAAVVVPVSTPVSASPARTHITSGSKLFVDQSDEFGMALSAALLKKQVPVQVVTDRAKADFFVQTTSKGTKEGGGERVAKLLLFGGFAGSGKHFDATVTVANAEGTIVFAHNSQKENFESAAGNVARMLKKEVENNSK